MITRQPIEIFVHPTIDTWITRFRMILSFFVVTSFVQWHSLRTQSGVKINNKQTNKKNVQRDRKKKKLKLKWSVFFYFVHRKWNLYSTGSPFEHHQLNCIITIHCCHMLLNTNNVIRTLNSVRKKCLVKDTETENEE